MDYTAHIGQVGSQQPGDEDLRVAQLLPLLPEQVKRQVLGASEEPAGPLLLAWWRRQDPLPASDANERLLEHLRRVAYAEEHYFCDVCPAGYDARGEVYVRYGAPERETEITFDDPQLIDEIYQPGVAISPGDFPDNTFLEVHVRGPGRLLPLCAASRPVSSRRNFGSAASQFKVRVSAGRTGSDQGANGTGGHAIGVPSVGAGASSLWCAI